MKKYIKVCAYNEKDVYCYCIIKDFEFANNFISESHLINGSIIKMYPENSFKFDKDGLYLKHKDFLNGKAYINWCYPVLYKDFESDEEALLFYELKGKF